MCEADLKEAIELASLATDDHSSIFRELVRRKDNYVLTFATTLTKLKANGAVAEVGMLEPTKVALIIQYTSAKNLVNQAYQKSHLTSRLSSVPLILFTP